MDHIIERKTKKFALNNRQSPAVLQLELQQKGAFIERNLGGKQLILVTAETLMG